MKSSKTNIAAVSLVVMMSLCGLQTSWAEKPTDVIVNNTTANPVPVTVQNPVTNVSVNNTTANPLPVAIQNPANSLSVTAADNPAFQPYARSGTGSLPTLGYDSVKFDVPAGKRLVIELVTVEAQVQSGQDVFFAEIGTRLGGGNYVNHSLALSQIGVHFTVAQPLRLYADAGTGAVIISATRYPADDGNWSFRASISGYLVDL